MTAVEIPDTIAPVKVGIGTPKQVAALREHGAEVVYTIREIDANPDKLRNWFREHDTVLMLQPALLDAPTMRRLGAQAAAFQVPGHDPVALDGPSAIKTFRRQKVKGGPEYVERPGGRPAKFKATRAQVDAICALWHSPMKRADVVAEAQRITGQDVPDYWVRDLVRAEFGTAARKPPTKAS